MPIGKEKKSTFRLEPLYLSTDRPDLLVCALPFRQKSCKKKAVTADFSTDMNDFNKHIDVCFLNDRRINISKWKTCHSVIFYTVYSLWVTGKPETIPSPDSGHKTMVSGYLNSAPVHHRSDTETMNHSHTHTYWQ